MTRLYALRVYARALARIWAPPAVRKIDALLLDESIWDGLLKTPYTLTSTVYPRHTSFRHA